MLVVLALLFVSFLAHSAADCKSPYPDAWVPDGYCAEEFASGLSAPRHIEPVSNGDILVVESGANQVTVLWDADGDGRSSPSERAVLARAPGLNHGLTLDGGYLYASSPAALYRWRYSPGDRRDLGQPQLVVTNIPADGHQTRTPVFDARGQLYLSLGSQSNVDPNTMHARVLRFNMTGLPITWSTGQLYANGLRNEVGLRFDQEGRLWGVMNGMDNVRRADLGGDIHNTNPAEQLNLLSKSGGFYGYPYCWAEYIIPNGKGKGKGTMWAADQFMHDGVHSDAWCQDAQHVTRPSYSMHPHTAPLDIAFYYGLGEDPNRRALFPKEVKGDAFVAQHGSWNSNTPVGYRVIRVKYHEGAPVDEEPFFRNNGNSERWPGNNNFRPVSINFQQCYKNTEECAFVSSDTTGNIVLVHNK